MLPPIQGYENKPLVSLEVALEPLVGLVPDVQQYALVATGKCEKPPADGLSIDESASIRLYTMEWKSKEQSLYFILNKTLRSENRDLLKDWFLYLKLIITALLKIPSTHRLLYRGLKRDLSREHPEGRNNIWWAFSSCTTSLAVLENGPFFGKTGTRTLFKIDCYSGKEIRKHSAFPNEDEVLLIAASHFRIVSCRPAGDGIHIIQLKETEPEFVLIVKGPVTTASPPVFVNEVTPTYDNPELQHRIACFPCHSAVSLGERRLTDEDMKIVIQDAIIAKSCTKLLLHNNLLTSQGISALATGLRESTTLEELDLSNNRLTDTDLAPLAKELSVNRVENVKQWKCCGIGQLKVSTSHEFTVSPII